MIRTFIALEIPEELKEEILFLRDKHYLQKGNARWEPKDKLHLTLKFLGDTDEKIVHKIANGILDFIENQKLVELLFTGFGIFKRDGEPKIFWAGFEENQNLVNLAQGIDEVCSGFGFARETKKLKPHLTLLRIRGHENIDQLYNLTKLNVEKKKYNSDTITFYKSILMPSGSEYSVIKKFYLKKEQTNVG
jgi:RNA 2',3'-cyclic 3'-phosphodiesterase